jgi:succinyl-diaminopimelate desuccinylase
VTGALLSSTDLVELTAALVAVPSVSGAEAELAGLVEARLRARAPGLAVYRAGDSVVARTERGGGPRIAFAGHLDTVPPSGQPDPPSGPDTVAGRGAVDMKGGLAVMLLLAEQASAGGCAASFIFYDREELGSNQSGLKTLFAEQAGLVGGDYAVVLEPTGAVLEIGCQGNLRVELDFRGVTAHSARPWRGANAIHRAAPAIARLAAFSPEPQVVGGLTFRQAFGITGVSGGRQGNMVPDECTVQVNYRHAPSVSISEATQVVTALAPEADTARVTLASPPAVPRLDHPLTRLLREEHRLAVEPKLGWTDAARFAEHGIDAVNFGPGDSELAHGPAEVVSRAELEHCREVLASLLAAAPTVMKESP